MTKRKSAEDRENKLNAMKQALDEAVQHQRTAMLEALHEDWRTRKGRQDEPLTWEATDRARALRSLQELVDEVLEDRVKGESGLALFELVFRVQSFIHGVDAEEALLAQEVSNSQPKRNFAKTVGEWIDELRAEGWHRKSAERVVAELEGAKPNTVRKAYERYLEKRRRSKG